MVSSRGWMSSRCRRAVSVMAILTAGLGLSAGSASATDASLDADPWQKMNRGIFWFNEQADIYVLAPSATGWRYVTPSFFRTAISNVSDLLVMPVVLANDIFQLKAGSSGHDLLRIVFNASFGLAGLIDVASMVEIPENDEDFGQTLGYWGVPAGPYLVLPLYGPSNIRDGFGRIVDGGGSFYFSYFPFWTSFLVRGVELVNWRSDYLEEIDENRRESFDYYVFLRNAYVQNRRAEIGRQPEEGEAGTSSDEDLYFLDDDEEDEFDADGDDV